VTGATCGCGTDANTNNAIHLHVLVQYSIPRYWGAKIGDELLLVRCVGEGWRFVAGFLEHGRATCCQRGVVRVSRPDLLLLILHCHSDVPAWLLAFRDVYRDSEGGSSACCRERSLSPAGRSLLLVTVCASLTDNWEGGTILLLAF
jgi:hypothetical protein